MAFRRPKSLRDFLVRARLNHTLMMSTKIVNVHHVAEKMSMLQNDNPCWYCEVIFWGHCKTEAEHRLHNRECCLSDLLQQLQQTECRRTKGPLNKRMNDYRDDWRHHRFERSPTAEHFHSTDHDFLSHASVCCLEHNKEWSDSTKKLRESYWIPRLNTLCPFGINKG